MKTMNIIETKGLTKHFGGVRAIDGLSLAIVRGAITGIVGPNGSGKTTLVNVLSGLLAIDGGVIVVGGVTLRRVLSRDVASYGLTRTFQEVRLFEQMTVLDNILVVLTECTVFGALRERHTALHLKKSEEVLQRVGLWGKHRAFASTLSYGQRKLLEIARVLAMESSLILFDEPFAGLFPEMIKVVANVLRELRTQGKTIVLIEHNMELIRELSDHVVVMDSGKLLAEGKPDIVLARRDVIEAYLGE